MLANQEAKIKQTKAKNQNTKSNSAIKDSQANKLLGKKRMESSNSDNSDSEYSENSGESSESSGSDESSSKSRAKSVEKNKRKNFRHERVKISREKPQVRRNNNLNRKTKSNFKNDLVISLLKRWWYVIDEKWYLIEQDIDDLLKMNKLRRVEVCNWKLESDENELGLRKCVELNGFPLVYADYNGKIHDLRNMDRCPSYNNFMKKVIAS